MFASPGGVLSFGRDPDGDCMGTAKGIIAGLILGWSWLIMVEDGRLWLIMDWLCWLDCNNYLYDIFVD